MSNFFAELKRRHIYRVGAAYVFVAYGLLQLVNNLAPALRLPEWALTLVVVLLAVGFPISLVFAWVHELKTPESSPAAAAESTRVDFILLGALAVVVGLFAYQQLSPNSGRALQQAGLGGISIAVLPFANVSADSDEDFFSDGMTDEVASALAKVPDLHIVARSSAFEFKGQNKEARAMGQALGASHLIEGSVRKAGDRVRISAQLIRADNGLQLWSENFDRRLTDIFAIQEDIAKAIAGSLRVPLGLQQGDSLVRNRAKDDATYEDYLRAKALIKARGFNRLSLAAKLLEQVVARDPDFGPAWAQLALAYGYIPYFHPAYYSGAIDRLRPLVETMDPKAEAAAERAIMLDPRNPEGYIALGNLKGSQENFAASEDLISRARALDPDNPEVLYIYSLLLSDQGYMAKALPLVRRLLALEPFVPPYVASGANILWQNGQTDEAIALLKPLATTVTGYGLGAGILARVYASQGRFDEAADTMLMTPQGTFYPGIIEDAARLLRNAATGTADTAPLALPRLGYLSWVYNYAGGPERVLEFIEESDAIHHWTPISFLWAQSYGPLRKTERFKALLRGRDLPEQWRQHGWPDLCRPQGADDFVCD